MGWLNQPPFDDSQVRARGVENKYRALMIRQKRRGKEILKLILAPHILKAPPLS